MSDFSNVNKNLITQAILEVFDWDYNSGVDVVVKANSGINAQMIHIQCDEEVGGETDGVIIFTAPPDAQFLGFTDNKQFVTAMESLLPMVDPSLRIYEVTRSPLGQCEDIMDVIKSFQRTAQNVFEAIELEEPDYGVYERMILCMIFEWTTRDVDVEYADLKEALLGEDGYEFMDPLIHVPSEVWRVRPVFRTVFAFFGESPQDIENLMAGLTIHSESMVSS